MITIIRLYILYGAGVGLAILEVAKLQMSSNKLRVRGGIRAACF
jgi:hypothetical protein